MIAHGMTRFCKDRMFDASDKYQIHVCRKCGMQVCYNDGSGDQMYANNDMKIHSCRTCGNISDFATTDAPYSFKLLSQELQALNVVPRIICD